MERRHGLSPKPWFQEMSERPKKFVLSNRGTVADNVYGAAIKERVLSSWVLRASCGFSFSVHGRLQGLEGCQEWGGWLGITLRIAMNMRRDSSNEHLVLTQDGRFASHFVKHVGSVLHPSPLLCFFWSYHRYTVTPPKQGLRICCLCSP